MCNLIKSRMFLSFFLFFLSGIIVLHFYSERAKAWSDLCHIVPSKKVPKKRSASSKCIKMFAFIIIYKIVVTWSVCETILFLVEIARPSF